MNFSRLSVYLCVALVLLVLIPAFTKETNSSQPFASVALAGHTTMGGEYCPCGCGGCICDPGETPSCPRTNRARRADQGELNGDRSPAKPESSGDGGMLLFGSLVFMALARFLWR